MSNRPKIGVALSGASGRAIAHIGVLEVLRENDIPIDYMVGCSSGALISASFATDTLELLKEELHTLTIRKLLNTWSFRARGAIFDYNAADVFQKYTKGLSFHEVANPRLGFVATDLDSGDIVNITEGDLLPAIKASCAAPGLFEPVIMNGRILVDGGLSNVVPTKAAKSMGADIVIGVNIASSKFIYEKRLPIWRGYRFVTRMLGLQFIREKILPMLSSRILFQFDSQSDTLEEEDIKIPGMLSVLTKALDHALLRSEQWTESELACDWMIEPRVKHLGKAEFDKLDFIYEEGRRAAKLAIPHIKKLIENYKPPVLEKIGQEIQNLIKD
ncbi:MAG: patatin-like phospholipase family protein [Candidatus Doudnabacteria bacterium]|nr:patatin-like phospholipase family protein [Candidatus Doudnabacteria bacterium]